MTKKENKIAYCIITYNHPQIIRDILEKIVVNYSNYGIDIYLYDSSECNDTLDIVNEFINAGSDNLFYVKIDSSVQTANKLMTIFSGYGLLRKYDYIWPAKDRSYFEEDVLQAVLASASTGYDCILLGVSQHPVSSYYLNDYIDEYECIEQFFLDWSWISTSVDVTIYRYDTLLKTLDLEEIRRQYFWGESSSFIHSAVLFHTLSLLEKPKIKVLYGEHIICKNSNLGSSSWNDYIFKIWVEILLKTVGALPHCYDLQKEAVIKKIGMLPWIFGSHDQMVYEREQNILTEQVFDEIKDVWGRLSDIPVSELQLIAEKKYEMLFQIIYSKMEYFFNKKQYDKFYTVFIYNKWVKKYWVEHDYQIVQNCINIFNMEKEANIEQDIFRISKTLSGMIALYKQMVYLLNKLEFSDEKSTIIEVFNFKNDNQISFKFFAFLIIQESHTPEIIMKKLEHILQTK